MGYSYVKIDKKTYHYITTERGGEIAHEVTSDPDELLYWLMSDVISSIASKYELNNRIPSQDSRRIRFAKEIDLFSKLKYEWADKKRKEIEEIILDNPYCDGVAPC